MKHPLHQLRVKLLNAIEFGDDIQIGVVIDEIFGALGGCEKCYGRGYLADTNAGDFCDCERGDKLKNFTELYNA